MNTLKARLKHARELKTDKTGIPWTQKHLALASGVSLATIGMLESGQRGGNKDKPPGTLPQIAKALGVRYEWLVSGELPMVGPAGALTQVFAAKDHTALQVEQFAVLFSHVPEGKRSEALLAVINVLMRFFPAAPSAQPGPPGQ